MYSKICIYIHILHTYHIVRYVCIHILLYILYIYNTYIHILLYIYNTADLLISDYNPYMCVCYTPYICEWVL